MIASVRFAVVVVLAAGTLGLTACAQNPCDVESRCSADPRLTEAEKTRCRTDLDKDPCKAPKRTTATSRASATRRRGPGRTESRAAGGPARAGSTTARGSVRKSHKTHYVNFAPSACLASCPALGGRGPQATTAYIRHANAVAARRRCSGTSLPAYEARASSGRPEELLERPDVGAACALRAVPGDVDADLHEAPPAHHEVGPSRVSAAHGAHPAKVDATVAYGIELRGGSAELSAIVHCASRLAVAGVGHVVADA